MLRRCFVLGSTVTACASLVVAIAIVSAGPNSALAKPPATPPTQVIFGETAVVHGNLVVAWARVHKRHGVQEVGVTIPVALFDHQPEEEGDGPAGAIASLKFPQVVCDTTFFNHFELQSNPHGHIAPPGSVNPDRNRVPHFDFHFYAITKEQVFLIPATTASPRPIPVPPAMLPPDYIQPGTSIAQMGRHSSPLSALLDPAPLTTVMLAGFTVPGDQMHFVEPMISREFLLERNDFELATPLPAKFGRSMRYPKEFAGEYDADIDAYHFVFSEFIGVE